ncbi:terpene synthase family protein [Kitasatospora sp. NPDC015120]|uniref:terpene synthase family protein n=1 Tax=Kitasatospora sp. NPDC015120 TaxID=3364023 RepID=UPI0036F49916
MRENVDRAHHPPGTLDDYLALRRHVVGYRPCQDMIERVSGYEIPAFLRHQSALQTLGELCTDLIVLSNDISSLEKEQARGEGMNAVLLLARTAGVSPRAALDQVDALASRLAEGFPAAAARVRDLADHLHLTPGRGDVLDRWIDANRNWLGAHNRRACDIPRFGPPAVRPCATRSCRRGRAAAPVPRRGRGGRPGRSPPVRTGR